MACLLTPKPERLVAVAAKLSELPEEEQGQALELFGLVTQFRMDRNSLPPEILDMVAEAIEINYRRNPVT